MFGPNLLQDRRPEFYGLLPAKDIYTAGSVAPTITQTFDQSRSGRDEVMTPERQTLVAD